MKRAQFLGVAIAGVCGVAAFFGVMSLVNKPAKVVKEEVTTNTTQVLVAKTEVPLGAITGPENFRWQDWQRVPDRADLTLAADREPFQPLQQS